MSNLLEELFTKFNPHHDSLGRFASGPGGAAGRSPANMGRMLSDDERTDPNAYFDRNINRPSSSYPKANPNGADTEQQHKHAHGTDWLGGKGEYTTERQVLHQAVIDKMSMGVTRSAEPTITMMGGGPASGKSTLIKEGHIKLSKNAMHVDADEMKKNLPEYREMNAAKSTLSAPFSHEESSYLSKVALKKATDSGLDATYDSTGNSSYKSLAGKVESYRAAGHKVVAHYVTVDTNTAVQRSNERGAKTGRLVPESVVRATHASVSAVLPKAIENGLFDEVTLWDTNAPAARKVASAKGKEVTIHDQTLWMAFLAKANE